MKNYILKTNDFTLEFELKVFDKDVNIPTNSILNIKINSDNFGAITTLKGCAQLKETYGNNFIIFKAMPNGHIYVNGIVNNLCRNGYEQELKFENEFDQTYLKDFVTEINQ